MTALCYSLEFLEGSLPLWLAGQGLSMEEALLGYLLMELSMALLLRAQSLGNTAALPGFPALA